MFSRAYRAVITLPPTLWVAVFLLVPYALLFCYSFWSVSPSQAIVHSWTLDNYRELFDVNVYLQTLFRSMWIAARVMIFSLLLGYPLAYYLSFYAGKRKELLYQLVIIPLWVSYLVRAYAWKTILGSDGVLNTLLQYVHLTKHPLEFLLYSPFAVVLRSRIFTPHSPFCQFTRRWNTSRETWSRRLTIWALRPSKLSGEWFSLFPSPEFWRERHSRSCSAWAISLRP